MEPLAQVPAPNVPAAPPVFAPIPPIAESFAPAALVSAVLPLRQVLAPVLAVLAHVASDLAPELEALPDTVLDPLGQTVTVELRAVLLLRSGNGLLSAGRRGERGPEQDHNGQAGSKRHGFSFRRERWVEPSRGLRVPRKFERASRGRSVRLSRPPGRRYALAAFRSRSDPGT